MIIDYMQKLTYIAILIIVMLQIFILVKQENNICDLREAFYAERQYTWNALRELGKEPDNYGKSYVNPIMKKSCLFR